MKKEYTYVGKLNRDMLGEYGELIINDEVILTNERKIHIKSRHLEVFDEIFVNIRDILYDSDYILEDNNNLNTLLMIKKVNITDSNQVVVVKLNTNKNATEKYNSVLTFWKMRNRNLKKQKIIYQKSKK